MIQTRKLLVVAALAAGAIAMAATDGITLRKTLKQGTESYHMEVSGKQTISLPGGADQDMATKTVSAYTYKIGAVDAAGIEAPTELTTKVEKFDVDGPMAEMISAQKDKFMVSVTVPGKLDSRNRFTADPNKKVNPLAVLAGSTNASLVGPFIEFPEKPVNIGDTWDVTIPKSPTTSTEDQKLTAKLVGDKDVDGKSVYVLSLTGTLKMNIDVGALMKANPVPEMEALGAVDMVITGSIEMDGEATVDKTTGQTLTMTLKMKTKQETAIAALGDQKIPSFGTATIKFTADK